MCGIKYYNIETREHNWSRNVLVMQIETRLLERKGKAITNFDQRLPKSQSDLARLVGDEKSTIPLRLKARQLEFDCHFSGLSVHSEETIVSSRCLDLPAGRDLQESAYKGHALIEDLLHSLRRLFAGPCCRS